MHPTLPHAVPLLALTLLGCLCLGCAASQSPPVRARPTYALVLHGGAGVIDKSRPPEEIARYENSLRAALTIGRDILAKGGSALDACEQVVRHLEDDPQFNAGRGAVYTEDERHELDASIMDGRTLACGSVAAVRTIKNPITLARRVMEHSRHVLLISDGAERFADELASGPLAVERVPNSYFDTPHRLESLRRTLRERSEGKSANFLYNDHLFDHAAEPHYRGTVGCVALDHSGTLAAATSTGGLTAKKWGRVGDSPIIGAGCFADNRTCAVSCTGTGEQFIRHGVARTIANLMEMKGLSAADAAREVVLHRLDPDDGGVIVVSHSGEIAMVFSTSGMFRGAADSTGRFEVGIWEDTK